MASILSLFGLLYWKYLYYINKYILRALTGKCAIERILRRTAITSESVFDLEKQLCHSKNAELRLLTDNPGEDFSSHYVSQYQRDVFKRSLPDLEKAIKTIISIKVIPPELENRLSDLYKKIRDYGLLCRDITGLKSENYHSENSSHEELLRRFWDLHMPSADFSRISKAWQDLGFQGKDPATDFRGMGILGLRNIVYMSETRSEEAKNHVSFCLNPKNGYSYAITAIDMTSMCYQLLMTGELKNIFYSDLSREMSLKEFHEIFCDVLCLFKKKWIAEDPENVMQYGVIRAKFLEETVNDLRSGNFNSSSC